MKGLPFRQLLLLLSESLHGKTVYETVSEIWENDRWFNFSSFSKTADFCAERLTRAGLVVEVLEVPADGRTRFGDWVMPQAWDVEDAVLTLIEPEEYERILARYLETPQCLFMYSAATPHGGVEADVVYVEDADKPESYEGLELKGKILLTEKPGPLVEQHAADHGAVGIISFKYAGHGVKAPPNSVAWENSCFLPRNVKRLFGFSLSPKKGLWLKNLVLEMAAEGLKVKVKAVVKTKLYEGSFKVVSALIPGLSNEEVWALAHLYEPGANDNASGCAVMIEVAEGVKKLIEEDRLPRPSRSLRFILTFECYGTMAYMLRHKGSAARVVAGINPDMVGADQEKCKSVLTLCENPHIALSFADALVMRIAEKILCNAAHTTRWRSSNFILDDNLIADPCFGIPTPAVIGLPDQFWHTSKDTPKILNKRLLAKASCLIAAYMLVIAYASLEDALRLLEETYRMVESKILERSRRTVANIYSLQEDRLSEGLAQVLMEAQNLVSYWREIGDGALESVLRLVSTTDDRALLRKTIEGFESRLNRRVREEQEAITNLVKRLAGIGGLEGSIPEKPEISKEQRLAGSFIPKRLIVGTLTFKGLPEGLKKESRWNPAYSSRLNIPLFWVDGKRSLLEIHHLLRNEIGNLDLDELIDYFHFLERAGYVKLEKKI